MSDCMLMELFALGDSAIGVSDESPRAIVVLSVAALTAAIVIKSNRIHAISNLVIFKMTTPEIYLKIFLYFNSY